MLANVDEGFAILRYIIENHRNLCRDARVKISSSSSSSSDPIELFSDREQSDFKRIHSLLSIRHCVLLLYARYPTESTALSHPNRLSPKAEGKSSPTFTDELVEDNRRDRVQADWGGEGRTRSLDQNAQGPAP